MKIDFGQLVVWFCAAVFVWAHYFLVFGDKSQMTVDEAIVWAFAIPGVILMWVGLILMGLSRLIGPSEGIGDR